MITKEAAPPSSEAKANAQKAKTDQEAGQLLDFDKKKLQQGVAELIKILSTFKNPTIVVTGGAGSGKSTVSGMLSEKLGIKEFDLDKYIEGGHTKDKDAYQARLKKAWYNVWQDLPNEGGWIIEHVEACNPELVGMFEPDLAILVDPGEQKLKLTAAARNKVGKEDPTREKRALETMTKAKKQFNALDGEKVVLKSTLYSLKRLES